MINKKLGRGFCNTVNAKIIELNNNSRICTTNSYNHG